MGVKGFPSLVRAPSAAGLVVNVSSVASVAANSAVSAKAPSLSTPVANDAQAATLRRGVHTGTEHIEGLSQLPKHLPPAIPLHLPPGACQLLKPLPSLINYIDPDMTSLTRGMCMSTSTVEVLTATETTVTPPGTTTRFSVDDARTVATAIEQACAEAEAAAIDTVASVAAALTCGNCAAYSNSSAASTRIDRNIDSAVSDASASAGRQRPNTCEDDEEDGVIRTISDCGSTNTNAPAQIAMTKAQLQQRMSRLLSVAATRSANLSPVLHGVPATETPSEGLANVCLCKWYCAPVFAEPKASKAVANASAASTTRTHINATASAADVRTSTAGAEDEQEGQAKEYHGSKPISRSRCECTDSESWVETAARTLDFANKVISTSIHNTHTFRFDNAVATAGNYIAPPMVEPCAKNAPTRSHKNVAPDSYCKTVWKSVERCTTSGASDDEKEDGRGESSIFSKTTLTPAEKAVQNNNNDHSCRGGWRKENNNVQALKTTETDVHAQSSPSTDDEVETFSTPESTSSSLTPVRSLSLQCAAPKTKFNVSYSVARHPSTHHINATGNGRGRTSSLSKGSVAVETKHSGGHGADAWRHFVTPPLHSVPAPLSTQTAKNGTAASSKGNINGECNAASAKQGNADANVSSVSSNTKPVNNKTASPSQLDRSHTDWRPEYLFTLLNSQCPCAAAFESPIGALLTVTSTCACAQRYFATLASLKLTNDAGTSPSTGIRSSDNDKIYSSHTSSLIRAETDSWHCDEIATVTVPLSDVRVTLQELGTWLVWHPPVLPLPTVTFSGDGCAAANAHTNKSGTDCKVAAAHNGDFGGKRVVKKKLSIWGHIKAAFGFSRSPSSVDSNSGQLNNSRLPYSVSSQFHPVSPAVCTKTAVGQLSVSSTKGPGIAAGGVVSRAKPLPLSLITTPPLSASGGCTSAKQESSSLSGNMDLRTLHCKPIEACATLALTLRRPTTAVCTAALVNAATASVIESNAVAQAHQQQQQQQQAQAQSQAQSLRSRLFFSKPAAVSAPVSAAALGTSIAGVAGNALPLHPVWSVVATDAVITAARRRLDLTNRVRQTAASASALLSLIMAKSRAARCKEAFHALKVTTANKDTKDIDAAVCDAAIHAAAAVDTFTTATSAFLQLPVIPCALAWGPDTTESSLSVSTLQHCNEPVGAGTGKVTGEAVVSGIGSTQQTGANVTAVSCGAAPEMTTLNAANVVVVSGSEADVMTAAARALRRYLIRQAKQQNSGELGSNDDVCKKALQCLNAQIPAFESVFTAVVHHNASYSESTNSFDDDRVSAGRDSATKVAVESMTIAGLSLHCLSRSLVVALARSLAADPLMPAAFAYNSVFSVLPLCREEGQQANTPPTATAGGAGICCNDCQQGSSAWFGDSDCEHARVTTTEWLRCDGALLRAALFTVYSDVTSDNVGASLGVCYHNFHAGVHTRASTSTHDGNVPSATGGTSRISHAVLGEPTDRITVGSNGITNWRERCYNVSTIRCSRTRSGRSRLHRVAKFGCARSSYGASTRSSCGDDMNWWYCDCGGCVLRRSVATLPLEERLPPTIALWWRGARACASSIIAAATSTCAAHGSVTSRVSTGVTSDMLTTTASSTVDTNLDVGSRVQETDDCEHPDCDDRGGCLRCATLFARACNEAEAWGGFKLLLSLAAIDTSDNSVTANHKNDSSSNDDGFNCDSDDSSGSDCGNHRSDTQDEYTDNADTTTNSTANNDSCGSGAGHEENCDSVSVSATRSSTSATTTTDTCSSSDSSSQSRGNSSTSNEDNDDYNGNNNNNDNNNHHSAACNDNASDHRNANNNESNDYRSENHDVGYGGMHGGCYLASLNSAYAMESETPKHAESKWEECKWDVCTPPTIDSNAKQTFVFQLPPLKTAPVSDSTRALSPQTGPVTNTNRCSIGYRCPGGGVTSSRPSPEDSVEEFDFVKPPSLHYKSNKSPMLHKRAAATPLTPRYRHLNAGTATAKSGVLKNIANKSSNHGGSSGDDGRNANRRLSAVTTATTRAPALAVSTVSTVAKPNVPSNCEVSAVPQLQLHPSQKQKQLEQLHRQEQLQRQQRQKQRQRFQQRRNSYSNNGSSVADRSAEGGCCECAPSCNIM